ncbi:Mpo1 family 2-hydroxy fatty acid dioxygenase [Fulvivirga sediminis]|uniref:DUF962 domain-containing protein n=1 Tax=Fulvivirga sediminis TaxID=2803949 RepID=A0A937F7K0_9BACT|nr:Mpo1-like protein [Fulvivirga sediminis]MBL3656491.1 DUF962 domain-containing protein [Fulvivirga sediminis]
MRKINQLLREYGESHQNPTNKRVHWVCVPLIFFSIVAIVWSIPSDALQSLVNSQSPWVNWASLVLLIVFIYYLTLSVPLALGMLAFSAVCLLASYALSQLNFLPVWALALIIFIIAWIGQFYGHKVEGKKPSFFKDIQFLMIGPAWLMHFIFKRLGIDY